MAARCCPESKDKDQNARHGPRCSVLPKYGLTNPSLKIPEDCIVGRLVRSWPCRLSSSRAEIH
jgi:hypothetical protein